MKLLRTLAESIYPVFIVSVLLAIISELAPDRSMSFSILGYIAISVKSFLIGLKNQQNP